MNNGRYTVLPHNDVTVFLIGMRVNKWFAVHKGYQSF